VTTHLLGLSSLELEEAISTELADNPALERAEAVRCRSCGARLTTPICPACLQARLGRRLYEAERPRSPTRRSDDADDAWASDLPEPPSLREYLMRQLRPLVASTDLPLATLLIESLDERGFLPEDIEAQASRWGYAETRFHTVLAALQSLEPPGIAARDVRECLLIQLANLAERGRDTAVARAIVRDGWDLLAKRSEDALAARLGLRRREVAEAIRFIRSNLTPYPALAYWGRGTEAHLGDSARYGAPDIAVYIDWDGSLAAEIFSIGGEWFRVNPVFRVVAKSRDVAEDELEGVERCVKLAERASLFIKCLNQRRQTLHRIAAVLMEIQHDYFLKGDRYLQPLTRAQVADILGLHESTISRAVAGKTLALPSGQIVPLSRMFDHSIATKDVIQSIIAEETEPLSDDQIAQQLSALGYHIARRTVAKYRTALGILPAPLRGREVWSVERGA
jgi:RNA polymerase sigma-54 factor